MRPHEPSLLCVPLGCRQPELLRDSGSRVLPEKPVIVQQLRIPVTGLHPVPDVTSPLATIPYL